MSDNKRFIKGDIVLIKNIPMVIVDCEEEYIFVARLDSYVIVETFPEYNYGMSDSGYEKITPETVFEKIGHIELKE